MFGLYLTLTVEIELTNYASFRAVPNNRIPGFQQVCVYILLQKAFAYFCFVVKIQ